MRAKRHLKIAKFFKQVAERVDNKMEEDENWIPVAAQNFFYAGIQSIEAILAKNHLHPTSHRETNRLMKDLVKKGVFKIKEVKMHASIRRGARTRVAYRGREGREYKKIISFAEHFLEKAKDELEKTG